MSDKQQHLEFIHNTINRMSDKSVQLKSISITLTAGLLAVYASTPKVFILYITVPQIIFFWLLDSYYLQQERKFRAVYDNVSGVKSSTFVIKDYEMPINKYTGGKFNIFNAFFSLTKLLFFGSMTIIMILLIVLIEHNVIVIS